jgi:hypothetical protein
MDVYNFYYNVQNLLPNFYHIIFTHISQTIIIIKTFI